MFNLANNTINGDSPELKNIGKFNKMILEDIQKEEYDRLKEYELTLKDVSKEINKIAVKYFKDKYNSI
jgi:hypothetical protein